MPNKQPKNVKGQDITDKEVEGFNIKINEFGEIICSHSMDKINDFLDKNVEDKKLPPELKTQKKP